MSLYQKYRPTSFDDVLGHSDIITALKASLTKDTCNRFILFSGPAGTGKTTIAKIVATTIGATRFSTAAYNTGNQNGVDTIRAIEKTMHLPSIDGAPLVFLFDEVHMLTKQAQEALLKPTEDIPDNVWFLFCTTNPEKLTKALRSRPMEIKTKILSSSWMKKLLKTIAEKEGIPLKELGVCDIIIDSAKGSARKAITLLEKVASCSDADEASACIGGVGDGDPQVIELCRMLLEKKEWKTIATHIKKIEKSYEAETVRRIVAGYMKAVLLNSGKPWAAAFLERFMHPVYETGWNELVFHCFMLVRRK